MIRESTSEVFILLRQQIRIKVVRTDRIHEYRVECERIGLKEKREEGVLRWKLTMI